MRATKPTFIAICSLAFCFATEVRADSIVVDGLELLLEEASSSYSNELVANQARTIREEYETEIAEQQALRDSDTDFILYDSDGNAHGMSQAEAEDLAVTIATDMITSKNVYDYVMALLSRADDGGQLDEIAARSIFSVMHIFEERRSNDLPVEIGDLTPTLTSALLGFVNEADAQNRAALDADITELLADRDRIIAVIARADAFDPYDVDVPAPDGFMNEPGYYLVQMSGSGWHKGGAGYATQIVGYENGIISVTDEVTEPTSTRWYWQVPPGFDIQTFERLRQEAAEESSRQACENLPALGPRNARPSIWQDGPHYELVQGPISDWNEARGLRGNPRAANLDPDSNQQWNHDSDHRWDDLDPVCERYGISLVD